VAAVLTFLFVAGAVVAFAAGVRKKRPWGLPAAVACGVVAVFAFIGWLGPLGLTVVAVLAGVGAVAAYIKGARPQKQWGKPALAACVGVAVLALLARQAGCDRRVGKPDIPREAASAVMQLIGKALEGKLGEGARVVVIRAPYGGETLAATQEAGADSSSDPAAQVAEKLQRQWQKGLEEGLGVSVQIVGSETSRAFMAGPHAMSAATFSELLDGYRDKNIDAWVSLVGIPGALAGGSDLEQVSSFGWQKRPLVAADVGLSYDPKALRRYIEDGLLEAALVRVSRDSAEMRVITKRNLGDLPIGPPMPAAGNRGAGK